MKRNLLLIIITATLGLGSCATVKHYGKYSGPETGKNMIKQCPAFIDASSVKFHRKYAKVTVRKSSYVRSD